MTQEPEAKKQKIKRSRPLIFNLMTMPTPSHSHPANWAKPGDTSSHYMDIDHWIEIAKIAEDAKFNAIFIADVLGPYDVYKGPHNFDAVARSGAQFPMVDPSAYISAMAAVTKNVGFGVTFSTIAEQPYHFGRRIATLDHLTKGRIGWNIVTSYLQSAARNLLNNEDLPPHDKRYERADQYVQAIYELLLSSWRDDAVVKDRKTLTYAEPSRIREINYKSEFFDIPGPFVTEPSPQRLPVLLQAGGSPAGLAFAAKHAEVIFVEGATLEIAKTAVDKISKIAYEKHGRSRENLRFIVGLQIIVAETTEEANAKFEETLKYHHEEGKKALLGGWTGIDLSKFKADGKPVDPSSSNATHSKVEAYFADSDGDITQKVGVGRAKKRVLVGNPSEVADKIQQYVDVCGIDGVNFIGAHFPEGFKNIVKYLAPELRKRGLLWDDYPVQNGTFRENLYGMKGQSFVPEEHIAYGYRWTKDDDRDSFKEKLDAYKKEKL